MKQRWHVITGEYPPQLGGVADYARLLAQGLSAAGDDVIVWSPRVDGPTPHDDGVAVRRLPGHFGPAALVELDDALARSPGRVLLQYTPHAFGCKAMNVPLCAWLWARPRRLDVMFHEVAFPFVPGQPLRHKLLASVHRVMASLLLRAAERVFVSAWGWESLLRPLAPRIPTPIWTPVPSNLPLHVEPEAVARVRARMPPGMRRLVGHFGGHSPAVTTILEPALLQILARPGDIHCLLTGHGSADFAARLTARHPSHAARIVATGPLDAPEAVAHIAACEVMLQPYPDGINARRSSAMPSLAQGRAIVSNSGEWCESIWQDSGAVELAPLDGLGTACLALLDNPERRAELGRRAAEFYRARFSLEHTIRAVRSVINQRDTEAQKIRDLESSHPGKP